MDCINVQNSRLTPAVGKAHTYHPSIPFIAHKKLTNVTTPVPHNSVRKTVIGNTLDRIQHKPRPLHSYDPMEDFLNERSVTSFEDVTRSIRANTAALLKKVHTPIPRSVKPLSVSNLYNHTETAIADRISSDEYIWHLLRPLPGKPSNGIDVGYYPESSTKIPLGKTHLACLSYAGGHPIAKRRQLVAGAGDDYRNVRNDVELLSHYTRMRQAANQPHENGISNDASSDGASRFKYNATTTPHTTEKVTTNGPLTASLNDDDKENIVANAQKPLKKKPSRDISIDEDQKLKDQERALREQQAEEERLEQERRAEEERLEQERIAEDKQKAEEERLEEERRAEEERLELERKAEEERVEQERLAEEERLEQERKEEEERLAKEEEEQRLLEEKLVEEYHREQERLAEEQRKREQEFIEEQQRIAQQKLAEEQQILHDKLMQIAQQQEAEEENAEKDEEEEEEEEAEKSEVVIEEVEEKSGDVVCNNIPKDSCETDKKDESTEEESEEASDEEVAIAENVQQNESLEVGEVVVIKKTIRSTIEYEEEFGTKLNANKNDDEKSEGTDANSDISEAEEEPNNSTVPELNHAENKDSDETQNEPKENKEEEETEEEEEEEDEDEEEEEEEE